MARVAKNRPLSPHLSIYKMIPSMVMSIVHRITGAALYFGMAFVAIWLVAAASGPQYYDFVSAIYGSIIGRLVLLGFTWALMHHMLGGMRHLIWDTGHALDKHVTTKMAWGTLVLSLALTVILWAIGLMVS